MFKRKTNEQFLKDLKEVNADIEPLEPYTYSKVKIECKCKICGNIWLVSPEKLLSGRGCPRCKSIKAHYKNRMDYHTCVTKVHEATNGHVDIIEKEENYYNYSTNTLCRCNNCGREFYAKPSNLICQKSQGCKWCACKRNHEAAKKTNNEFINELKVLNPNIEPLTSYTTEKQKVLLHCKKCDCYWEIAPTSILSAGVCPICNTASAGEKEVERYLVDNHIFFISQKAFDDLKGYKNRVLRFDFYLPDYKTVIEYNGEFHDGNTRIQTKSQVISQRIRDHRKMMYCKTHNIRYVSIWYYERQKMNKILDMYLNK